MIDLTTDQLRLAMTETYNTLSTAYDEMTNLPYPSPAYTAKRTQWNDAKDRWNALQAESDRREAEAKNYTPRHGLNWNAFDPEDDGAWVREAEANEAGK